MDNFVKCKYSIEELENLRDKNGFIDLSSLGLVFNEASREKKGTIDRIKNWVDFNGTKVLIRGEIITNESTYGIYAELIVEEISKQMGIETAHYDLIKIKDENGNDTFGVLSESMVNDLDIEQLVTLYDIIGDISKEEIDDNEKLLSDNEKIQIKSMNLAIDNAEELIKTTSFYEDITKYDFTIDKLRETLLSDGYYTEDEIEQVILDYKKRLAFSIIVLDGDKHLENIAFIKSVKDGKHNIRISPNYDSEKALLLETPISYVEELLEDSEYCRQVADGVEPKIGFIDVENGWGSFWRDTLEKLYEDDDEMFDFFLNILDNPIDMDAVFNNVEKRIKAPIPEDVKTLSKFAYSCRNNEITKVIEGGELEQSFTSNIYAMLDAFINIGTNQQKIRTDEQIEVGKMIEKDMILDTEKEIENFTNNLFGKENR